jgi:hypothetical protein
VVDRHFQGVERSATYRSEGIPEDAERRHRDKRQGGAVGGFRPTAWPIDRRVVAGNAVGFTRAALTRALMVAAAGRTLADGSLFFLNFCPGSGEGRENRPQLRCGNVSNQTHTLRTNAGTKPIGVASGEGEGRGRGA